MEEKEYFICNRCGRYCDDAADKTKCEGEHFTEKDVQVLSTFSYWPRDKYPTKIQVKIGDREITFVAQPKW
jgi:hypothetical protein